MTGALSVTSTLSPTIITDFTFTAANGVAYVVNWDLTNNGDGYTDIHYSIAVN